MKVLLKLLPRAGIEMGMERLYSYEGTFSGERDGVHFYCSGCINVYNCQKSLICIFKISTFNCMSSMPQES